LVVPAFAVGRTQDLIYVIRKMEDAGEIPTIPVHIDSPMAIEATDIYCRHTEEHDFEMAQLSSRERCPISSRQMVIDRTPEESKAINDLKGTSHYYLRQRHGDGRPGAASSQTSSTRSRYDSALGRLSGGRGPGADRCRTARKR
jgi:hypothetical protein